MFSIKDKDSAILDMHFNIKIMEQVKTCFKTACTEDGLTGEKK